jgi:hypothetical protein
MSRSHLLPILTAAATLMSAAAFAGKAPEPGTSVEMPYVIAPITIDDKLTAYAYISSKIIATSPSAAIDVRLKTPFLQDAFVRDVNALPVCTSVDASKIDSEALVARLLKDTRRIMGQGKVANVAIIQIQIAQLRPSSPH